jgi:hypothetical protein
MQDAFGYQNKIANTGARVLGKKLLNFEAEYIHKFRL